MPDSLRGSSSLSQARQLQSDSAGQQSGEMESDGFCIAAIPVTWGDNMARTICGQAFVVVATFLMACQCYLVRLPLLPWRQEMARILFIIRSLAAGGRHSVSALVSLACHPFGRVDREEWRWLHGVAINTINKIFENMDKCHRIVPNEVWQDASISRRNKNIPQAVTQWLILLGDRSFYLRKWKPSCEKGRMSNERQGDEIDQWKAPLNHFRL